MRTLISFISIVQFSAEKIHTCFGRFITQYFIILGNCILNSVSYQLFIGHLYMLLFMLNFLRSGQSRHIGLVWSLRGKACRVSQMMLLAEGPHGYTSATEEVPLLSRFSENIYHEWILNSVKYFKKNLLWICGFAYLPHFWILN